MKRPCRACGCPIEFIMGPNEKEIPVQKVRSVYALNPDAGEKPDGRLSKVAILKWDHYVSHFETCSDPGRF